MMEKSPSSMDKVKTRRNCQHTSTLSVTGDVCAFVDDAHSGSLTFAN